MRRSAIALIALGSSGLLSAQPPGPAQWSGWRPDATFPGIEVRERCAGFNEFANRHLWDVQLRNTYDRPINLSWAAEPGLLHGAEAQADHAIGVRPGEIVDARHTAPKDCSAGLLVRVRDVRNAGDVLAAAPSARTGAPRPRIEGHWKSRDPEPYQKELQIQLSGRTVTGVWTSPGFSFQITTPLPENVGASISVDHDPKPSTP
jgi:hypothetical protein